MNLPQSMHDIPSPVKEKLFRELNSWKSWKNPPNSENDIRRQFQEGTGYLLRMYWLGRTDKLPNDTKDMFEWMTLELPYIRQHQILACPVLQKVY